MDTITLAANVTTLLIPFLTKMGESAMEEVGTKLPEKVGKVWSAIAARFKDNPTSSGAASDLAKNAKDPDNQETFDRQLRKVLRDDPDFADMLAELLKQAQDSISNVEHGAVATDGSIAVGNIEIGGDMPGNIVVGNNSQVGDHNNNMNLSPEE